VAMEIQNEADTMTKVYITYLYNLIAYGWPIN